MLITLSRRAAICHSVVEVELTGVTRLGTLSHRFTPGIFGKPHNKNFRSHGLAHHVNSRLSISLLEGSPCPKWDIRALFIYLVILFIYLFTCLFIYLFIYLYLEEKLATEVLLHHPSYSQGQILLLKIPILLGIKP